jgi:ATP-dependent RNA helicase DHX37/DHR1
MTKEETLNAEETQVLGKVESRVLRLILKGITILDPQWLAHKDIPLCTHGRVLEQPEPRYDAKSDRIAGYILPTYGPKAWQLPLCETELEDELERTKWFARFLLEGRVQVDGLSSILNKEVQRLTQTKLVTKPSVITKQWASTQKRVQRIVHRLLQHRVCTRAQLQSQL